MKKASAVVENPYPAACGDCGVVLALNEIVLVGPEETDQEVPLNEDGRMELCYKCAGQRLLTQQKSCQCGYPLIPDAAVGEKCSRCKKSGRSKRSKRVSSRKSSL